MVGICWKQIVHHRHGQNHQQADDGVQTQEAAAAAAAAAAAEPRQPVHEGTGPSRCRRRGRNRWRGAQGPRRAAETPTEAPASGGPAGPPAEALGQCGA